MTQHLDDLFADILLVRRKGNRTGNLFARASRVARGAPEVMTKITGFGKSTSHIRSHLDYISRKGKIALETDTGETLEGKDIIGQYRDAWNEGWESEPERANRRHTLHLVLSMPAYVDPESIHRASRSFAQEIFQKHEYVFALHTDSKNPHCHLVVKMKDRDGKRINPRKADLQHWRETFAEKVREQGYEAEATSRLTRGITRKREKAVIRHIDSSWRKHRQRTSKVRASKIREAVNEMTGNLPAGSRPWERAIRTKQAQVRQFWLLAAAELDSQTEPDATDLSRQIRHMVAAMPPIETERERTKRELMERFGKKKDKTVTSVPEAPKGKVLDTVPKKRDRELER